MGSVVNTPQKALRIFYGLLASLAVFTLFDFVPSLPYPHYRLFGFFWVLPGVDGIVSTFVLSFVGAYVAKTDFVIPSIVLALAIWILAIHILYLIAAPAGQGDYLQIAGSNVIGMAFSLIGAVLGASYGLRFAKRGGVLASDAT